MTTTAPTTAPTTDAPKGKPQTKPQSSIPVLAPVPVWSLGESAPAERTAFLHNLAEMIDALRTAPKGMEREDRAEFVENAKRARLSLIRTFPLIEAMHDRERFTLTVRVTVRTADGEKTADTRAVRLTDAVYARLGLYGRTMESVGLA